MSKNQVGSTTSSDHIDAKLEEHQTGRSEQCPGCGHKLERKPDWLGLPAGVKFDPTDPELIGHLEAKVESEQSKSHPLIDEFIPTIEGEDGICYTHPEKLPGVARDGISKHFFHRPSKAYTTGTRKRRKIQTECDLQGGETRWHKTGKTRPVIVYGKQKGCKKILVLYTNFGKHRKPEKTNWVMHQYHLGQLEEEKEGELVVSKIFYQTQPRQCNWSERSSTGESIEHRRESGSGSSSSKDVSHRDELSGVGISSYSAMDIQQMKSDNYGFAPFGKTFDEVGVGEGLQGREASSRTCEKQEEHVHQSRVQHVSHEAQHQQQVATAAFHISRRSNSLSTIISPPVQQNSSLLDDPYHHVSRIILQNQQQQQQHHQKLAERSSGLEELIMGCTSTDIKVNHNLDPDSHEVCMSYGNLDQTNNRETRRSKMVKTRQREKNLTFSFICWRGNQKRLRFFL